MCVEGGTNTLTFAKLHWVFDTESYLCYLVTFYYVEILSVLFQSKFAKALYDNVAECPDELAFRRGDVVTVLEQSVADTSGWWMCSLHGRRGLAPANRLELLLQTSAAAERLRHDRDSDVKVQNIYQIPSTPRPISSPAYERMDMVYKVPSVPLSASCSPIMSALRQSPDGTAINKVSIFSFLCLSVKG